jgi:hypothetical protein
VAKAASAAARAARDSQGDLLAAARLAQSAAARLSAELFADAEGAAAAADFLAEAEAVAFVGQPIALRRRVMRAALDATRALGVGDIDQAVEAATELDLAVESLQAESDGGAQFRMDAAFLRCERADLLIGFGSRLKDRALLEGAEEDLAELGKTLDPNQHPLTWARVETLRGSALARLGELSGDASALAEAVRILAAAAAESDYDYSPLDRARASHALALALASLAEATEDRGFYDHALAAFDQALASLEASHGLAMRPRVAHDRAACTARMAELAGDAAALARAEEGFRAELAGRNAAEDPVAWAVVQVALARIYVAQSRLLGGERPPRDAAVCLTEAMDVFVERGMKSMAEAAQEGLERLRGSLGD